MEIENQTEKKMNRLRTHNGHEYYDEDSPKFCKRRMTVQDTKLSRVHPTMA